MSAWTPERVETLKKLWADGLSASLIGAEIGKTRNAVIGKAHRMRLEPRAVKRELPRGLASRNPTAWRRNGGFRAPLRPRRVPREAKPLPPPPPTQLPSRRLTIDDLKTWPIVQCRYMAGFDRTYCGHPVKQGTSWCEYHLGIVEDRTSYSWKRNAERAA